MTIESATITDPTQTRFSNTSVAESDYKAALNGLDEYYSTTDNKLAKDSQSSLVSNIKRMINLIPDRDFDRHVGSYHYSEDDDCVNERQDVSTFNDLDDSYQLMEDEGDEYDDEDLLDPQALEQAQKLREQVRQIAQRIYNLRDSVVGRALGLAESPMIADNRPLTTIPRELSTLKQNESGESITASALNSLRNRLSVSQLKQLPNKLRAFQDTLETIQTETRDDKPMSQTEKAILSQDDDDTNDRVSSEMSESSPQKKLTNFFLMQDQM